MARTIIKPQQRRDDRLRSTSSSDNAIMRQIQATHSPNGCVFDAKPILSIIEGIMHRASPDPPSSTAHDIKAQLDALEDMAMHNNELDELLELLAITINKISCKISCTSGRGDAHTTTMGLFKTLSNYQWEAKAVIALAAFAVNYGEFWLVAQLSATNPLAKSVATLKQLPDTRKHGKAFKPRFDGVTSLIKAMLDITKCIVEFKELQGQYTNNDIPEMLTAIGHIPIAVFWTIKSIVVCSSMLMNLIIMGHEYNPWTTEASSLSSLAQMISNIHSDLKKQLDLCYHHINERREIEAYQNLVYVINRPHTNNMKILKTLIYAKDDQLPLYNSSARRRVSIEVMRKKNVLLLISDLNVSQEELEILDQMYKESRQHSSRPERQYEVVWLPVVNRTTPWNETKQKKFETLQNSMPWYSVFHPFLLDSAVIKYINKVWSFNKKPLLVVVDPQGRIVNTNALPMMWIWGSKAFPFTSLKEEVLWNKENWKLELLAHSIEPMIFNWISEGKYICIYGGDDIEWIRRFTKTTKAVAQAASIPLEMLYVGKSNPRENILENNATIVHEGLGHVLVDLNLIRFFWVRLQSMWQSKLQQRRSVENDPIMQEIMTILSFDGSDQGWAVVSKGPTEMTKAKGDIILKSLDGFDQWKDKAREKGFLLALIDNLQELQTQKHCNQLILPETIGRIPEMVVCAECGRVMEMFIMYRCCPD